LHETPIMKRILFTLLFACAFLLSGAQSLQLYWPGGTLINNQDIELWCDDTTTNFPLYVANTSSTDVNVWVRKTYLSMITGSHNYYCWGQCQPEENMISSVPVLIPATTTDSMNFIGHYTPHGNPGTSVIRYTFFNDINPMDSFCVNVVFHGMTGVGMNEDDTPVFVSDVFPNPARDHFNLRFIKPSNAAQAFCLQLYNSSGILVKLQPMNRLLDIQHINIIGLAPGVYFCVVMSDNQIYSRQKLVIQ